MNTFGLDSEYDYDPVWTKCEELGIAPDFHSVGYGWGSRTSIFNYVHNHIGNFVGLPCLSRRASIAASSSASALKRCSIR